MIVQCDSGHLNSDLIACARYRVCDEAIRAKTKNKIRGRGNIDVTHILFVIRLPQQEVKSQFVGFQGDPWFSVHIDDLRATSEVTVIPEQALNASISELFIGRQNSEEFDELELQQDSGSQSEIEAEEEGSDDEMSYSAEHSQSMRDDIYSDQDMSGDEASVQVTLQLPSVSNLEEANPMDNESDELPFGVPERAFSSALSIGAASNMMEIEDTQLYNPSLNDALHPVELMQDAKLPSDTVQTSLSPSDLTKEIKSILPVTPIQYFDHNVVEPAPHPMADHPIVEVPTLDSVEDEEVPCQENKMWTGRMGNSSGSFHPQHHRLLGCVQAAVSMLKDSQRDRAMHRIQKLMALIPKIHPEQLGQYYNCSSH